MPRKRGTARWVVTALVLTAAAWGIYSLIADLSEKGSWQGTERYYLPALSITLTVLSLALVGLLVRNLVRLVVDLKRGILGSKLRTKLVIFLLGFTLLPTLLMVYGSAAVMKRTVEAIIRTPVEEVTRYSREIVDGWNDFLSDRCAILAANLVEEVTATGPVTKAWTEEWRRNESLGFVLIRPPGEEPVFTLDPDFSIKKSDVEMLARVSMDLSDKVIREGRATTRIELLGEELLVIAAAPFRSEAGAVSVGLMHSGDLTSKMKVISEEADAYRQFRLDRRDLIRIYLMLIFLILLVTLFSATWIGFYLGRRITEPIEEVAAASREISAGNLEVRVQSSTGDEVGMLVESFNEMAAQLQESREVIIRSTADLRRSNKALDERRRYIEILVANLSTGVISLDRHGKVTTTNPAVKSILGVELELNSDISDVLETPELAPLHDFVIDSIGSESADNRKEMILPLPSGTVVVSVQVSSLSGGSGEHLGTLVMVRDLTDLVRAQRAAAWREVARRIAHEIKNPLTPIQLAAQRLGKKFTEKAQDLEEVVPEATASIEREVAGLKRLVDEFSQFARMPELSPRKVDMVQTVESLAALYRGHPEINLVIEADPDIGEVEVDPQQMRRAILNLVDNAIAAMNGKGTITIGINLLSGGDRMRIEVADAGPGIPHADRDKLFVPYFSNKPTGTGLGLAIVHRIVTDHRGTIMIEDNQPRGARFVIEIPV